MAVSRLAQPTTSRLDSVRGCSVAVESLGSDRNHVSPDALTKEVRLSDPDEVRAIDRREFMVLLGAAGVASILPGATAAIGQTSTPPTVSPAAPTPAAPPSEDARSFAAILKRRYPDRFTDAQWESITKDFDGDLALGKRLRGMKLSNSDEPDSTFKV